MDTGSTNKKERSSGKRQMALKATYVRGIAAECRTIKLSDCLESDIIELLLDAGRYLDDFADVIERKAGLA